MHTWSMRSVTFLFIYALLCNAQISRREEIATCCESAYASLAVSDAARMMFFDNEQDLLALCKQVCV